MNRMSIHGRDAQQVDWTWMVRVRTLSQKLQGNMHTVRYCHSRVLDRLPCEERTGRIYARESTSAQSLPRFVRPLIYGNFREIDQRNAVGRILVQVALAEVPPYNEGDDGLQAFRLKFPTLYRYGGTEEGREEMMASIQAHLQERANALRDIPSPEDPSLPDLGSLTALKPPQMIVEEERREPRSSFNVSKDLAKQHCMSMLFRPNLSPKGELFHVPLLRELYEEGNRFYGELSAWSSTQPRTHWMRLVYEQAEEHVRSLVPKNKHDPINEDSELAHSRSQDPRQVGQTLYKNPKGSFLTRLFQEIETRIGRYVAAFLAEVVQRHNKTRTHPALPVSFPLIHDGIIVPFDPTPGLLRALTDFVHLRTEGNYRPLFGSKPPATCAGHAELQRLISALQERTGQALEGAIADANKQRYEVGAFAYTRLTSKRDIYHHRENGRHREEPLTCEEFILQSYRGHWEGRGLEQLKRYLDERRHRKGLPPIGDLHSVPHPEDVGRDLREVETIKQHLLTFYEMSWWFSRIFFKVRDAPVSDRPYLERLAEGRWAYKSEQELLREHGHWKCRMPENAKTSASTGNNFMRTWMNYEGTNPWEMRWVTVVHRPSGTGEDPGNDRAYVEAELEPVWDPTMGQWVHNEFLHPSSDFQPSYWYFRHTDTASLEEHPTWRWWCHFVAHLFVEPELVGYWHRYWAHMIQCPDDPPTAFIYLFSEHQGCGKGIAMRVIQAILGMELWYGGTGAHKRVLRNDGGETEGRRKRLLFLDEACHLNKTEYDMLTGMSDNSCQVNRQLYQNATMVRTAARIVLLSNDDDVLPPRNEHVRRRAAIECSSLFQERSHSRNFHNMLRTMRTTIGASRHPENLSESAKVIIAECYRRIPIQHWSPETVPDTLFGSIVQFGPKLYRFACSLAAVRYAMEDKTNTICTAPLEGCEGMVSYHQPWSVVYEAYRHWSQEQNQRNGSLLKREDFQIRLVRLCEAVLHDAMCNRGANGQDVVIHPVRIQQHLNERKNKKGACDCDPSDVYGTCDYRAFEGGLMQFAHIPPE